MHTPSHFLETDANKLTALINDNAFAALVSVVDGTATASHIPFLYDQKSGVLLGHVARANPQWQTLAQAQDVLVIFQGPHAYVSPTWYHRPSVPTWNYAVVHIHGSATTFDAPDRLRAVVDGLANKYEAGNKPRWSGEYDVNMLKHIIGIEIRISRIEGQFKLSQNRPAHDRATVIEKLHAIEGSEARRVADMMGKNNQ